MSGLMTKTCLVPIEATYFAVIIFIDGPFKDNANEIRRAFSSNPEFRYGSQEFVSGQNSQETLSNWRQYCIQKCWYRQAGLSFTWNVGNFERQVGLPTFNVDEQPAN